MSVAFDTLKAAQRLNAAGFSEDQAASLAATFAEGITENLATKDDIALVHKEMEVLGKDIKALDTRIDTSIAALDARIDTRPSPSGRWMPRLSDLGRYYRKPCDQRRYCACDKEMEVLGKDIKVLDARIDTSIAALDDKLRSDMTIRLGGIVLGGITALKLIENFLAN